MNNQNSNQQNSQNQNKNSQNNQNNQNNQNKKNNQAQDTYLAAIERLVKCSLLGDLEGLEKLAPEDFWKFYEQTGMPRKSMIDEAAYSCGEAFDAVKGQYGANVTYTINITGKEDFDALDLQVGQTYLVYGENYADGNEQINKTYIYNHRDAYEELFGKVFRGRMARTGFPLNI